MSRGTSRRQLGSDNDEMALYLVQGFGQDEAKWEWSTPPRVCEGDGSTLSIGLVSVTGSVDPAGPRSNAACA